jgi:hypothetical protein
MKKLRDVLLKLTREDRGVSALIIAGSMFLVFGMASIAIDASALFVERRADQTAADVGAVAAGVEVLVGVSTGVISDANIVNATLEYVEANLPTDYTPAEWQALWEGCVDPASERNAGGFNFVAMSPPAGWTVTDPANWCISRDAQNSLYRVRTPNQVVETTFAKFIGFNSTQTSAAAVVNVLPRGGGILPFGFPSGTGDGAQHCLSAGPPGLSSDPCTGPVAGNFGTLKITRYTPSPYNGCLAAPQNSVLALNIAAGIDHILTPMPVHDPALTVNDACYNPNVNTLGTQVGFPMGTEWGLISGNGLPAGETALLQQGSQPKQNAFGYQLDNRPLWHWLLEGVSTGGTVDYGGGLTASTSDDAPLFCDPAGFTSGSYDVDGDGTPESQYDFDGPGGPQAAAPLESWQHVQRCLLDYAGQPAGTYTVIFDNALGDRTTTSSLGWSPRFNYVPQFWDSSLGPGVAQPMHIWRFRAIFVQGVFWTRGIGSIVFHPGEPCTPCTGFGGWTMTQVSAFIIPDAALPEFLRGDPPGGAVGVNPYIVRIYR